MKQESYFDGGYFDYIWRSIVSFLLIVFSLGILLPWAVCFMQRWVTNHTIINGERLIFTGKAINLFGSWIKWLILGIITFGIYFLIVNVKMQQWITKNTFFVNKG